MAQIKCLFVFKLDDNIMRTLILQENLVSLAMHLIPLLQKVVYFQKVSLLWSHPQKHFRNHFPSTFNFRSKTMQPKRKQTTYKSSTKQEKCIFGGSSRNNFFPNEALGISLCPSWCKPNSEKSIFFS